MRQAVALRTSRAREIAPRQRNGTRSSLHTAWIADRAVNRPDGSPPPGMTQWPTIKNRRRPGSVLRSGLKLMPGVNSQPSMLPFQLFV